MNVLILDADRTNHETFRAKNPKHKILFCYDVDAAIRAISTYDYHICLFNVNTKLDKLITWLVKELSEKKRPYTTLFLFHNEDRAASYKVADRMFEQGYYVVIKPGTASENIDQLEQSLPPAKGKI